MPKLPSKSAAGSDNSVGCVNRRTGRSTTADERVILSDHERVDDVDDTITVRVAAPSEILVDRSQRERAGHGLAIVIGGDGKAIVGCLEITVTIARLVDFVPRRRRSRGQIVAADRDIDRRGVFPIEDDGLTGDREGERSRSNRAVNHRLNDHFRWWRRRNRDGAFANPAHAEQPNLAHRTPSFGPGR